MAEAPPPDCRICLEGGHEGRPLIVPCECAGTCKYVHKDCLEHWVLERGSASCEVCKAPYAEEAMTELGRRRIEEQRRRELEWPQHDSDFGDEAIMLARPALATRRLLFFSTFLLFVLVLFLSHDEDPRDPYAHGFRPMSGSGDITDEMAEAYLAELGLRGVRKGAAPAPPGSALPAAEFGAADEREGRDAQVAGDEVGLLLPPTLRRAPTAASRSVPLDTFAADSAAYDDGRPLGLVDALGEESVGARADGRPLDEGAGGAGGAPLWADLGGGLWPEHSVGFGDGSDEGPTSDLDDSPSSPSSPSSDSSDSSDASLLPPSPPESGAVGVDSGAADGRAADGSAVAVVPADPEQALLQLIDASDCVHHDVHQGKEEEGAKSALRTCELAMRVLHHIRQEREVVRERDAEQEAGEAMGRLMRAFVLLCILRIVIAHQQRRRIILDRQIAWERDRRGGGLPV